MKTAISLTDDLYDRAEQAAARLGLNRSELYARALSEFLQGLGPDPVTERLDKLVDEHRRESVGSAGAAAGRHVIDSGGWEW